MIKFKAHKITPSATQTGFSLMEVLVSVFLVGFALLALVAMQVKTQAGVREAENVTIVAMAVDSLAEGMRANPTLAASDVTIGGETVVVTKKSWPKYITDTAYQNMSASAAVTGAEASGVLSKDALVTQQLSQFKMTLNTLPAAVEASAVIGNGKITVTWKTGKSADTRSYAVSVD